jgi:phosphatidylinositol alpha-1,6-mannosyltransferase
MPTKRCLLVMTGAFALGGGIAAANRLVIHALADSGYIIDLFALNEDDAVAVYGKLTNIRQRGFRNNKLAFTLAVWMTIARHAYDFVFCDHVNLAFSLVLPAKLGLVRYIVRLNGMEVFAPLPNFEGRMGLANAWQYQAISQFTKDKVLTQFPHLQISVVDLALSQDQSSASEQNSAENNSPPLQLQAVDGTMCYLGNSVLLHVGRMSKLEQYKGQDKLIESITLVLAKHPDTQLVLVGKGDDSERLRMLACSYPPNVQQAIFMPGFVPNTMLEQLYRQC